MPCFLSFDFEFTHPVPRLGAPMQLGIAACQFWEDDEGQPNFGLEMKQWSAVFHIDPEDRAIEVAPWVKSNQAELLSYCHSLNDPGHNDNIVEDLKKFLRGLPEEWRDKVIPVGWCLGSDMAYLLELLGQDCGLVHYSARDLDGILVGLMGVVDPSDEEVRRFLGVDENPFLHDALSDARHQLGMVQMATLMSWASRRRD